jgi:class 3 adenylate cyclase/tetratricopeptide (TPR) repeat protein
MIRSANLEFFGAYLPIDRRHALHNHTSLPECSEGTVLFADISGFTPLSASLTQELGPQRGVEEITRQLDRVYGALVAEVDRFGGSVISFSGDAITCWFADDRGRRVVACALAMQSALRDLATIRTPGGKAIVLAIKVSTAAGAVRRFLVGDPELQLIEAVAGRTLDRLDTGQRLAQKGEVLIDLNIAMAAADDLRVSDWRVDELSDERFAVVAELLAPVPDQPWPALPAVDAEAVRAWMLPPVYERLRSGQGQFLAELRPAVTLFLRFDGIDYDVDEAAGRKLDAFIRWVQRVVDRYGGSVLQLSMGEKGSYLQAAFGAPIAHEDDLRRAASAALDLIAPPSDLNFLQIHIGLSSGQMRTGAYGSATRRTYGVLGNETNLAARMMQAAQAGQILVPERLAKSLIDFELQPVGSVQFKGVAQPVFICEVRGRQRVHPASAQSPLIGRTHERAALMERFMALKSAQTSSFVIVEADAGLGKSRLVAEAAELAQSLGLRTLVTAADAIERSTPFYAWRAIFNRALGLDHLLDPTERRTQIMTWLEREPRWQNWGPLLSDILQLDWPPNETTAHMAAQVQADNLQELLLGLLDMALHDTAERSVLIFDDGEWLDSTSWALLSRAGDRIRALVVVLATRPPNDPIPIEYQQLLTRSDVLHLMLEPLPAADVAALIGQRLDVDHVPAPVIDFIRRKAEGHPFFSEELAFALRDAGLIEIADRQCRLKPGVADLHGLDFPSTIQGVITSRIDRLPPQQRLTVKVASVIGRIFSFRLLNDIYPVRSETDRLHASLDMLTALDITRLDVPEPDLSYIFKHIITQEVAYNLMLFTQRSELHRAVAEWYERTYAADLSPYYSLLAYHWLRAIGAGPVQPVLRFKAIHYLDQAGLQALRSSAYKEAIAFFDQAAALEPPVDSLQYLDRRKLPADVRQRAYRYLKWGEAQRSWGTLAESRASFEWAAVLYGYPLPRSSLRVTGELLKQLAVQGLHRLRPARYLGQAPADQRDVLLNTARTYQLLSEIFYFTNEGLLSLYAAILCLNLCEAAGPSYELAEAYAVMCVLIGSLGQRRWAETNYQRALAVASAIGQSSATAHVLRLTALYRLEDGQWEKAEQDLTRAIEILDDWGNKRHWGDATAMLASLAAFRGQLDRASQLFIEIAGPRSGSLLHRTISAVWRGRVANLQGRFEESIALLKTALELSTDSSDPLTLVHAKIHAWAFLASAYLRQGRLVLAREAAEMTCQLIADSKAGAFQVNIGMAAIVEVNLALCERDGSLSDLQRQQLLSSAGRLCKQLRRSSRASQARAWHSQGLYLWHSGKHPQALKAWQKSVACAEELQMPYDEAVACYAIGRHAPGEEDARREHLQRARDLFDRIGAPYDRALAEAALDQITTQRG